MKIGIETPNKLIVNDERLLAIVRKTTFIIGVKLVDDDPARLDNLKYLLFWINHFYASNFETIIVEQGEKTLLPKDLINEYSFLRYVFLYNPSLYNRGWGYNVAIKNYCENSEVVVVLDTDILPTKSFLDSIIKCHEKYKFVSPYKNIYYTNNDELSYIKQNHDFSSLENVESLSNPVTLTGGVAIFRKSLYISVCGYEQYVGYGGEDRALDVTITSYCEPDEIYIQDDIFPHLFHPRDKIDRSRTNEIMQHLWKNYGCKYYPDVNVTEYIHSKCTHRGLIGVLINIANKIDCFGYEELYKSGKEISINGTFSNPTLQKSFSVLLSEINDLIKINKTKDAFISAIHEISRCADSENAKILKNKISLLEYLLGNIDLNINSYSVSNCFSMGINREFGDCYNKNDFYTSRLQKKYSSYILKCERNELESLGILAVVVNHNINYNAELLRDNLSKYFDSLIIDSGSVPPPLNSLKLNNVYYGGLINEAYMSTSVLGYKRLLFVCSDVEITIENIENLKYSLLKHDLTNIGIYSPSSDGRSHPFCKNNQSLGLRAVPFVEGFIFLADTEILREFLPSEIKYGWGLDFMKGFFSRKKEKLCVVDDSVTVYHPPETGYSNNNARIEMYEYFRNEKLNQDLSQFFSYGVEPFIKYWKSNVLISVIIPCYNHGDYLKMAVMSVLKQYYNNVEVIVVDDGSSDCTKQISMELSKQYSQIRYLYKINGGLSSSRNAGLAIANGDFIQFLDADDFLSENKFISQLQILKSENSEICVSNYKCFKEESPDVFYKYSRETFVGNPLEDYISNWEKDLSIPMHCFLFKKETIDGIFFDESLPNHEDWDFHIKVAARNPKYSHDPNSFAFYRVRSNSMSRDKELMITGLNMVMNNAINSSILTCSASKLMLQRLNGTKQDATIEESKKI